MQEIALVADRYAIDCISLMLARELVRTGARSSETIGRYSPTAFGEEIAVLANLKPVASLERYSLPG
jgi:hypothetical protein